MHIHIYIYIYLLSPVTIIITKPQERFSTVHVRGGTQGPDDIYIYIYIYMHACMYVCMYVWMYVCMSCCRAVCCVTLILGTVIVITMGTVATEVITVVASTSDCARLLSPTRRQRQSEHNT